MTNGSRRIAVTGAAGRIGGALALRLLADGHDLVLLDRRPIADPPARFVAFDLRDAAAVAEALSGVDVVCHLGEIPNLIAGHTPQRVFDTNTAVCRSMLEASTGCGVSRFIYTSSCQRYGYWGGGEFLRNRPPEVWPIDERLPAAPQNEYAASKALNEEQCRHAAAAGGPEVYIFRLPWVMLPGTLQNAERHWTHIDRAIAEGFWTYLDVRDAVEAYALAVREDRPLESLPGRCEAFHFFAEEVSGPLPTHEKLRRYFPGWPALPPDWPARAPPVTCAKAERYLGWRPAHRLSDALPAGLQNNPAEQIE